MLLNPNHVPLPTLAGEFEPIRSLIAIIRSTEELHLPPLSLPLVVCFHERPSLLSQPFHELTGFTAAAEDPDDIAVRQQLGVAG